MSDIIKHLGIEEDELQWYHLAACKNMPVEWFFDDYENDSETAKQIDQMCLNCPVIKECLQEATKQKNTFGVWGGIYLTYSKASKQYNKHKTPEVIKKLRKIHGKSIL